MHWTDKLLLFALLAAAIVAANFCYFVWEVAHNPLDFYSY